MTVASGQKIRASVINDLTNDNSSIGRGIIARGTRSTSSSTTTTETAVMRFDDIPLKGGRTYLIMFSNLFLDTTVANDVVAARVRYTTDGTTPTTSSTQIHADQSNAVNATDPFAIPLIIDYSPASDELFSFLLSVARISGTGNVSITAGVSTVINGLFIDLGVDPGDTGTDL